MGVVFSRYRSSDIKGGTYEQNNCNGIPSLNTQHHFETHLSLLTTTMKVAANVLALAATLAVFVGIAVATPVPGR